MTKKIKAFVWGNPGAGKSVFAAKFPKPFFICTDGNYDWLIEFGAKPDAHVRVNSFKEYVKFVKNNDFSDYETIVVDLIEDLFKMCEQEWLKRNEIEHPSDMGWGKGYDGPRNEFFIEMCKLLNLDKNIIFICHAEVLEIKQKKGTSYHVYKPSSRMPEKLLDMFEGRVRFMVRALSVSEEIDGKKTKKRYLQISSSDDDSYINVRGIDEDNVPEYIPLEYDSLMDLVDNKTSKLTLSQDDVEKIKEEEKEEIKHTRTRKTKDEVKKDEVKKVSKDDEETDEPKDVKLAKLKEKIAKVDNDTELPEVKQEENKEDKLAALKAKLLKKTTEDEQKSESTIDTPTFDKMIEESNKEEVVEPIVVEEIKEEPKVKTKEERLAELRAKLRGGN